MNILFFPLYIGACGIGGVDGQKDGRSVGVQRELRVQMWHTYQQAGVHGECLHYIM